MRLISSFLHRRPGSISSFTHVRIVVDKVALGLFFLHVFWLSHTNIIATKLRTHLHLKLYFYQKNICEEA